VKRCVDRLNAVRGNKLARFFALAATRLADVNIEKTLQRMSGMITVEIQVTGRPDVFRCRAAKVCSNVTDRFVAQMCEKMGNLSEWLADFFPV